MFQPFVLEAGPWSVPPPPPRFRGKPRPACWIVPLISRLPFFSFSFHTSTNRRRQFFFEAQGNVNTGHRPEDNTTYKAALFPCLFSSLSPPSRPVSVFLFVSYLVYIFVSCVVFMHPNSFFQGWYSNKPWYRKYPFITRRGGLHEKPGIVLGLVWFLRFWIRHGAKTALKRRK